MDTLRIQTVEKLIQHMPMTDAIHLEYAFWSNTYKTGLLHNIPVWKYANDDILFETDREALHTNAMQSSYLTLLEQYFNSREDTEAYKTFKKSYYNDIANSKKVLEEKTSDNSTLIKCIKCKSSEVDIEQKQTRSRDEPMTLFCHCKQCDKRFIVH